MNYLTILACILIYSPFIGAIIFAVKRMTDSK
jgi:hypothetical protein